ncbi:MAG: OmpH family outer membrane protein [Rikenellaceae bacterium]|nr:OmpH family outer membrane protein [Rikenellaceae bacterium]
MKRIFIAALAFLAIVGCKENKQNTETAEKSTTEVVAEGDLAFVNVDYVMAESDIFKTEGIALRDKTEKTQQKWAKKEQSLQNEINQLAEKYQKGLITTRSAQEKEQELQKRAASMQTAAQKEGKELEEESIVFQNRMNDLLMRAIQDINADKKYKMIVAATALLDADESLNLTEKVLAKVNELYKTEKEESKKR